MSYINGPVNAWRLEGTIAGIHKILYIYSDVYLQIKYQTQCDTYNSSDVVTFFNNELFKQNKQLDFFMELSFSDMNTYNEDNKNNVFEQTYANKTKQLFVDNFKKHKNIRFHHIDIKDKTHYLFRGITSILDYKKQFNINSVDDNTRHTPLMNSLFVLDIILTDLLHLIDGDFEYINLKLKNKILDLDNYNNFLKDFSHLFTKLLNKYNNKDIKQFMIAIVKDIKPLITELLFIVNHVKQLVSDYYTIYDNLSTYDTRLTETKHNKEIVYGIDLEYVFTLTHNLEVLQFKIWVKCYDMLNWISDIYFMRRFLDKNYIANSILYCSTLHSIKITQYLIRNFDFKLTHISYYNKDIIKDKTHITNYIKNKKNTESHLIKLLIPVNMKQCVDFSDFPSDFN